MHVWGISVDLDSIAQFLITAFLVLYGLVYVVRNTASKYFVVDASFEGGGSVGGVESSSGKREEESESVSGGIIRVDPVMTVDNSCVLCGQIGTKQCSLCKAVRYCTAECQKAHWRSGHRKNCKKAVVANGDQKSQLKKVLFPYDEFVKLYNWRNSGFPPCGLVNCGNSCFANVVLQCLTYTKPLTAYLLLEGHRSDCKKEEWCFLCEFETHVKKVSRRNQAFSPVNILSRLPHIGGNLGFGNQEDAHEFMRFAIDSMQSVFLDQFGGEKALHPSSQETTLIQYIFGGHLLSQVKCTTCSKVSNRYESMMDLTVEIHGDSDSLEECLDQFTTPEWLDGENMYKCDGCNAYVNARKRLSIQQPPNILTIALKRFQSGRFGKLNKRVTFPETLDLSSYMTNAVDGTNVYNLYAVVVHIDMLNASYFGHYICYIKDFGGNWYRIDDCKVVDVDVDEVLSAAAYMLLYCRNHPRESHQMPTEPAKGPEPAEKLGSFSTSFQSVATSASVSASGSWGAHIPVKTFSACDYMDHEGKYEATSKYINCENENGGTRSWSLSNGIVIYDNGQSVEGSDSGCSLSTDKVSSSSGNGHHNQGSVARSPSCNDVPDHMEISDGVCLMQKEIGDQEQAEKRPAKRKKEIGADSGLSDVSNTDAFKQKKKESCEGLFRRGFLNQTENKIEKTANKNITEPPPEKSMLNNGNYCSSIVDAACSGDNSPKKKESYEGLFRRGFLDQNGNKLEKTVNKNIMEPTPDKSMFKKGNICSSIVDAACSGDNSPTEKLGSDVEDMLCADVKGHMNMSTCTGKVCDQEVIGGRHTASDWPSSSPDSSSEGKLHAEYDEHPCIGNYFSADSTECVKDIQIDAEVAPCPSKATNTSANGCPEGDVSNTDHVSGHPSSAPSLNGKFCSDVEISGGVLPSSPVMEINGGASVVSPNVDILERSLCGKICLKWETMGSRPLLEAHHRREEEGFALMGKPAEDRPVSTFCCNDGYQQ